MSKTSRQLILPVILLALVLIVVVGCNQLSAEQEQMPTRMPTQDELMVGIESVSSVTDTITMTFPEWEQDPSSTEFQAHYAALELDHDPALETSPEGYNPPTEAEIYMKGLAQWRNVLRHYFPTRPMLIHQDITLLAAFRRINDEEARDGDEQMFIDLLGVEAGTVAGLYFIKPAEGETYKEVLARSQAIWNEQKIKNAENQRLE